MVRDFRRQHSGILILAACVCMSVVPCGCKLSQNIKQDVSSTFGKHDIELKDKLHQRAADLNNAPIPDIRFGPSEVTVIEPAVATQLYEYRGKPMDILPVIRANLSEKGVVTVLEPYRYAVTDTAASMAVISNTLIEMGWRLESVSGAKKAQTHVYVDPSVGKALALIKSLLSPSGRVEQVPGGWVSVTDLTANLESISLFLQDADLHPGVIIRQKDISMNVYTCRNREPKVLIEALKPHLSKAGNLQEVPPDKLIICDRSSRIKMMHKILDEIDRVLPQVIIESKTYEVFSDVTADYSAYITWRERWAHHTTVVSIEQRLLSTRSTAANAVGTLLRAAREGRGNLNMGEVQAYLDFLVSEGKARVLTEPWITVVSGEKASISTGDEIPYRAYQVVSGTESFITEYQTAEIKLDVTPRVISGGLIEMQVSPEVDSISGYRGPEQVPVISKRKANTKVIVASGDTLVIGGLRKEEKRSVERGLPILRHIPLLGIFFRSNDLESNRTELFIAINPRVVSPRMVGSVSTQKSASPVSRSEDGG